MDKLKILNTLNNLIEDHWEVDIQELFEASLTEPDKKSKKYMMHFIHISCKDDKTI